MQNHKPQHNILSNNICKNSKEYVCFSYLDSNSNSTFSELTR